MAVIFYAEDEKEIRDIVSAFLINDGYEVIYFENGESGVFCELWVPAQKI